MAYMSYSEFQSLYGTDVLTVTEFYRIEYEAELIADIWTTGIDGYHKLQSAFPINPVDAEAVRRCIGALIMAVKSIEDAEKASIAEGQAGAISSVHSGSESITYTRQQSAIAGALADMDKRNQYYGRICRQYLSGRQDANGINLMYMGAYPHV